jgi:hypothetical protein
MNFQNALRCIRIKFNLIRNNCTLKNFFSLRKLNLLKRGKMTKFYAKTQIDVSINKNSEKALYQELIGLGRKHIGLGRAFQFSGSNRFEQFHDLTKLLNRIILIINNMYIFHLSIS